MEDASIEDKQKFLCETILDKGYDSNQFVQFLINKRGEDGADIANWTMNDLKQVVTEFTNPNGGQAEKEQAKKDQQKASMFGLMNDPQPKNEVQNENPKPKPQEQQNKEKHESIQNRSNNKNIEPKKQIKNEENNNLNNINNDNINKNSTINKQNSGNIVNSDIEYGVIISENKKCKPTEITDLSKHDIIKITISNPEKKDAGFFNKSYITYLVSTSPVSYKVRRRYSDFVWLRTTLQNHFPSNVIPPIPKKNTIGVDKFADSFSLKRARGLEKFMNYLANDPIIKNSQLFYDFLFIGAETDFNCKKKVYEKVKQLTDVQDFREVDENAKLLINREKEGYLENIKDYASINTHLFKKINYSFKLLFDEMNTVINRMEEISKLWAQLNKAGEKYFDNNTTCESYKQMSNLFKIWSKTLKEQNTVINVDIREHFKYSRKTIQSIKVLVNSVETYRHKYHKGVKSLINKKEDLFKRGDPSKWELDPKDKKDISKIGVDKKLALVKICSKETLNVIGLKEFYGYYLNKAINEYERMRNLMGSINKNVIITNINKLTDILGQFHICVGEIKSALDIAANIKVNDNKCQLNRIPYDENLLK